MNSYLQWLLGFLEEPDDVKSLLRHTFPSKVGGRPVCPTSTADMAPYACSQTSIYDCLIKQRSELLMRVQAWLDPVAIPPQNALISRPSGRPLNFLLQVCLPQLQGYGPQTRKQPVWDKKHDCLTVYVVQVYSPLDDSPLTFHRTIFLFVPQDVRLQLAVLHLEATNVKDQ